MKIEDFYFWNDIVRQETGIPVPTEYNYPSGKLTFVLGIPWFTPAAIVFLNKYCKTEHRVLEFGSGGSTIFFAERCYEVHSFEHSEDFFEKVKEGLRQRSCNNVHQNLTKTHSEFCEAIKGFQDKSFDIILVDTDWNSAPISRSELGSLAIPKLKSGGILIVDNYYYPQSIIRELCYPNWEQIDFNDPFWWGAGTKIAKSLV